MEDRWFGNEFQILGATDENDLEAAMVVLRGGTHIEKDKQDFYIKDEMSVNLVEG